MEFFFVLLLQLYDLIMCLTKEDIKHFPKIIINHYSKANVMLYRIKYFHLVGDKFSSDYSEKARRQRPY